MVLGGERSCEGCLLCGCDEHVLSLTRRTTHILVGPTVSTAGSFSADTRMPNTPLYPSSQAKILMACHEIDERRFLTFIPFFRPWVNLSRRSVCREIYISLPSMSAHTYVQTDRRTEIIECPTPQQIVFRCLILLSSCVLLTAVRAQPN